jgi:inorganic pyrophosphatase
MPDITSPDFWDYLDRLVAACSLVIDRPKGSAHPRLSEAIYPLDYGYLAGTTANDGAGVDVWRGSGDPKALDAVALTVDLFKQDVEIKLLLGCREDEKQVILDFMNYGLMRALLVRRHPADH